MAVISGLEGSFTHNQNGMIRSDMEAAQRVADKLREVIIFRSTGPWAKRWLGFHKANGDHFPYPSKSFHAKGKSSDWGPHAGLVPFDGTWSKVGANADKARKGTGDNTKGILSGFIQKTALSLTSAQIDMQCDVPEGDPPRRAVELRREIPSSPDLLLVSSRSGDEQKVVFRARKRPGREDAYDILVYPLTEAAFRSGNPGTVLAADPTGARAVPLEVMTSNESGADNRPMTGDYDLWAVCPLWSDYGSLTSRRLFKPAIRLAGGVPPHGHAPKPLEFAPGVGMDNVLDTRQHTMGSAKWHDFRNRLETYRSHRGVLTLTGSAELIAQKNASVGNADLGEEDDVGLEHNEMGNVSPRILRVILELNKAMRADDTTDAGALRRVHHNAEVARYRLWFALTALDMVTKKTGERYGDGFPLTVFQPSDLSSHEAMRSAGYGKVCTLETRDEFRAYAEALKARGYYVPKNWIWDMSRTDANVAAVAKIEKDFKDGLLTEEERRRRLADAQGL